MIDREHDLPITKQAEVLEISRGSVYYLPRPCLAPTSRSCGASTSCIWSSPSLARGCCEACWLPRVQDRPPACQNADAAWDRGALPPSAHNQPEPGHRSIPICCAAGDHAPEPGLGDGHHLHPDGARVRVSRGRARLGDPPGSVVAAVDHHGSGLLRRDPGGRLGASRQAGDLQHRPGLAVHRCGLHRRARRNGIAISMDGKGAWRDNVFVERLWRSVNTRRYICGLRSVSEPRFIGRYLDFYNRRRPHSSLTAARPSSLLHPTALRSSLTPDAPLITRDSVQTTGPHFTHEGSSRRKRELTQHMVS